MQPTGNKLVKRFVAPTMRRALDLVREEMGPEAVILSSQKVPDGVEVITSMEPDLPTRGINVRREFGRHFDNELDTAMHSDSAWQMQAGVDQAAAHYGGRVEMNEPGSAPVRKGEQLAREIERARERMLAAKRDAKEQDMPVGQYRHDGGQGAQGGGHNGNYNGSYDSGYSESYGDDQGHTRGASNPASCQRQPAASPESVAQPQSRAKVVPHSEAQQSYSHQAPNQPLSQVQAVSQPEPSYADHWQEPKHSEAGDARLEQLQSELADMRMILEQQLWRMGQQQSATTPSQINMPVGFNVLHDHMERLGLPEDLAQKLLREAGTHDKVSKTWRHCMARLARDIPVTSEDMVDSGGIFAFVGQTGVGKTTTIAKLAARHILQYGAGKVALVTTDTYRVGAYDQLRSLGRILNVPVRAVDAENSLITVLAKLKQFPLILIDTAGFRHGDPLLKDQLRKLDTCPAVQKVLVMACNSQLQTMKASSHAYNTSKGVNACVLTKLDEATSIGEAISVILERQIPVAYTSAGQEIPKDITCATGHNLIAAAVAMLKQPEGAGALQSV